jgi:hypothetical protein
MNGLRLSEREFALIQEDLTSRQVEVILFSFWNVGNVFG